MINFTGVIKVKHPHASRLTSYINTNSIFGVDNVPDSRDSRSEVIFNTGHSWFSEIPPEVWAQAIVKADTTGEIVDVDALAQESKKTPIVF